MCTRNPNSEGSLNSGKQNVYLQAWRELILLCGELSTLPSLYYALYEAIKQETFDLTDPFYMRNHIPGYYLSLPDDIYLQNCYEVVKVYLRHQLGDARGFHGNKLIEPLMLEIADPQAPLVQSVAVVLIRCILYAQVNTFVDAIDALLIDRNYRWRSREVLPHVVPFIWPRQEHFCKDTFQVDGQDMDITVYSMRALKRDFYNQARRGMRDVERAQSQQSGGCWPTPPSARARQSPRATWCSRCGQREEESVGTARPSPVCRGTSWWPSTTSGRSTGATTRTCPLCGSCSRSMWGRTRLTVCSRQCRGTTGR